MGQDVSAEVAELIGSSKVFGSSDNIRHGTYKFLIKRCFSDLVEMDAGKHRMSFVEVTPLESKPNPQFEGDHIDYPGTAGPLKDDGNKPNAVGSNCALKVDHDGAGARSAGSNVKAFILGLFNAQDGQISDDQINKTWIDLARRKPCKAGDIIGFDPATQQPVKAAEDKIENPACGMVINCTTTTKKKKTPNDKGAFITKLVWSCASPIGTGENSKELVAKRRAEILANQSPDDDEEVVAAPAAASPQAVAAPSAPAVAAPPPPPAAPAAPAVSAEFVPQAPWTKHPLHFGPTLESQWYFSDPAKGGNGKDVKNAAALKAGL